jgi:4-amino-4-deoxy-L-arabinose transferase-like glycosyltransferase
LAEVDTEYDAPRESKSRVLLGKLSWPIALELTLVALAVWAHVAALPKLPQGFYKDEVSIVYNAYLIATTGHDEFGVSFPMYTKSWGDYKNAGYVYLCVAVMRVVGLSSWTVRITSVLCWLVGTWAFYSLGRARWPRLQSRLFLLLLTAFTPSVFILSRMAFEVIGLYPLLALFLLGVQRGFEAKSVRWAAVAGFALGSCTYMYSTFRLLAPLHCVLVLLCYATRQHLRSLFSFAASAACSVIPFAWYMYAHGENLTARYREIGYVHQAMPWTKKLGMFVARYFNHLGLDYLLLHGDQNRRLHTGFCGELFAPVLLMVLLAIGLIVAVPALRRVRFHWLLLGGLVLSPVAAALTMEPHNSLRAFSLVVFSIPLAVLGFHHGLPIGRRWLPPLVLSTTLLCAGAFVADYYGPYRKASIIPFEYFGMREAIVKAARAQASRIVIDNRRNGLHADLYASFYTVILKKRWGDRLPPLQHGRPGDVKPGEYFIYEDRKYAYRELRADLPPESLFVAVPHGPALQQLGKRKKR